MKLKEFTLTCLVTGLILIGIITVWSFLMSEQKSNAKGVVAHIDSSESEAYKAEVLSQYNQTVTFKVSNTLTNIYNSHQVNLQLINESIQKYGPNSNEVKTLCESKCAQDLINTKMVTDLIDKYGWLGTDKIGAQNNYTLFMTIQNSDFETQQKYLPIMEKAVKSGSLAPENYASLVDRKAMAQHQQQVFGTQLKLDKSSGKYSFAPIANEAEVNIRRAQIGLSPLQEYAKQYNIAYILPQKGNA